MIVYVGRQSGRKGINDEVSLCLKKKTCLSLHFFFFFANLRLILILFHCCLKRRQKLSTKDTAGKNSDLTGNLFQRFISLINYSGPGNLASGDLMSFFLAPETHWTRRALRPEDCYCPNQQTNGCGKCHHAFNHGDLCLLYSFFKGKRSYQKNFKQDHSDTLTPILQQPSAEATRVSNC